MRPNTVPNRDYLGYRGLQLLYGRNDALQHSHSAAELNSYAASLVDETTSL